VQRCGDRAVLFEAPDAETAFKVCNISLTLAGAVVRRETV